MSNVVNTFNNIDNAAGDSAVESSSQRSTPVFQPVVNNSPTDTPKALTSGRVSTQPVRYPVDDLVLEEEVFDSEDNVPHEFVEQCRAYLDRLDNKPVKDPRENIMTDVLSFVLEGRLEKSLENISPKVWHRLSDILHSDYEDDEFLGKPIADLRELNNPRQESPTITLEEFFSNILQAGAKFWQ